MTKNHWLEIVALVIMGEGVLGVIHPKRHLLLWRIGPKPFNALIDNLISRPAAMRVVFATQFVLGYFLAKRQIEK